MTRRSSVSGFTLVETLVATVLMVAILGALATVTAQWLPNWNRGFARLQRAELVGRGLERMAADLAAAQFVRTHRASTALPFHGDEFSVTFVRSALGPNTPPGLEVVRLTQTADARGFAIVRTRARFAPLTPGTEPRLADPVVLLRGPYRITFSYAGDDRVWRNIWSNGARLPRAVRILVRDSATGQVLPLSTAVAVHVTAPLECVYWATAPSCALRAESRKGGMAGLLLDGDSK
jgi:general secretion pathway protein J